LRLASVPYGWTVGMRNWLYERGWKRRHRAAVPVVSIGNVTAGGTGKTPCVEYVARFFRGRGLRVAILSRGYAGHGEENDEAKVLEANLPGIPHLQGPDRARLADRAVAELESEVLLLDDGFQHRRLARDLDVVLIDATNPWGHGFLLPRGLLRESPRSLRRAGVVVLSRSDQVTQAERGRLRGQIASLAPDVPLAEAVHRPVDLSNENRAFVSLACLQGRPVAGFCGLGNPEGFRRTLHDLGAKVCAFRTFPDHHAYSRRDVADLGDWARQLAKDCVVVTTQKDLVKLRLTELSDRELWALRIQFQIESGQEELDRKLEEAVHG
jgi:tetraacyldisaccharide 4'-kinase